MDDADMASAMKSRLPIFVRLVQGALMLVLAVFLGRDWLTSGSWNLFAFGHRNQIADVWAAADSYVCLFLVISALSVLARGPISFFCSVVASAGAFSIYFAAFSLQFVDKFSDQTYLLSNPYLAKPVGVPLTLSIAALAAYMARLRISPPIQKLVTSDLYKHENQELISQSLSR